MPEQKASIYDGEREVLRDVTVDLNEGETEVWADPSNGTTRGRKSKWVHRM